MTPKSKKRKRARRKVRIANTKLLQQLFGFVEDQVTANEIEIYAVLNDSITMGG